MLKCFRNLPRVGAGFLGLALVLMLGLNANAASLRRGGVAPSSGGGAMFGVPAGANPANVTPLAPPSVQEFSLGGSGNANFSAPSSDCVAAGLSCNSGQTCQCFENTGSVTDGLGPLYHGSAFFILNVVISQQYPNG